ncbi:unnamed protein product [Ixodes pacificus]
MPPKKTRSNNFAVHLQEQNETLVNWNFETFIKINRSFSRFIGVSSKILHIHDPTRNLSNQFALPGNHYEKKNNIPKHSENTFVTWQK